MASDYTIIVASRRHLGNEEDYLKDVAGPNLPFVGPEADFTFNCPNVNPGERAVLMFQTLDVDSPRNVIDINRVNPNDPPAVPGGIPVSPVKNEWNGNVMLIEPNVLRETNNVLHIESRTQGGNTTGDIDDFVIDNVVVLYKRISLQ